MTGTGLKGRYPFFLTVNCPALCIFGLKKQKSMQFKDIIGQQQVKARLLATVRENRIAHTQLFLGPEGSGAFALAIAYAQYINCPHKTEEDSCGVCPSCVKYRKFAHPDLHFIYPTAINSKVKKNPQASLFHEEWHDFLTEHQAYITQGAWYEKLGIGNKQGTIYARDANEMIKLLNYKTYESPYKVVILFQAERLHPAASNKLLKSLEEPPENTLIILVAERYELIIPTVRSRAQLVKIPPINAVELQHALVDRFPEALDTDKASALAALSYGSWNRAVALMDDTEDSTYYFVKFREWMRLCFRGNDYFAINEMVQELSRLGREKQKKFLGYGLQVIHNTLFVNEKQTGRVMAKPDEKEYLQKFAPYINRANRREMYDLLNEAVYHIERNAHPGILFADLSFRISRLMQKGKKAVLHNE